MFIHAQILIFLLASLPLALKAGPNTSFSKTMHRFGKVFAGQKLEHEYRFKNTGDAPLKLLGINTSCGCTIVDTVVGQEIAPGKSSTVKVKFDTTDFKDTVSKSVVVMTNEKIKNSHILSFTANIVTRYKVDPPVLNFGQTHYDKQPLVQEVTITPKTGAKLTVEKINYPQNKLSIIQTVGIDGSLKLSVSLKERVKAGFFKEDIKLKIKDSVLPSLIIPVTASIQGPIRIPSKNIELGSIKSSKGLEKEINFVSQIPFEPKIQKLVLYLNGNKIPHANLIDSKLVQTNDKKEWALRLSIQNTENIKGSINGKVMLSTNIKEQRNIDINIHGLFL